MMQFRTVKTSLIDNVLGPAAAGRFVTVGFQRQSSAADQKLDSSRTVQVYFAESDFSRRGSGLSGPVKSRVTFRVDMSVAKAATGDLSVINNPVSTPAQIQAALAAFQEASDLADQSFDELVDIVYQIIMDARNVDLGLSKGDVGSRWVESVSKDTPLPRGDLIVLTGSMRITCEVSEDILGDEGVTGASSYDTVVDIEGDDVEQTGILKDNP